MLADANDVFWTRTAWRDEAAVRAFMTAEPHLGTMERIDEWCDEATFVAWDQDDAELPDWQTGFHHLVSEGNVTSLPHGSAAHRERTFPPPVLGQ